MNPSASGWIKKHLGYVVNHLTAYPLEDHQMYDKLRENGFIYGTSVATLCDEESEQLKWTEEEKTKINLFDALVHTFYDSISNANQQECIQAIIEFYAALEQGTKKGKFNFLKETSFEQVEKIIDHRIQTNEPLLKKNFSHLITNALLYIDVLAFEHFLITDESPEEYARHFEAICMQSVWIALSRKQKKDTYNELLMKLFESSIRYNSWPIKNQGDLLVLVKTIDHPLEKKYLMDICALAIGSDQEIDSSEMQFFNEICQKLRISFLVKKNALLFIVKFIERHKEEISYLKYSNPLQHFYNQTSKTVSTLVLRNKIRLTKEISQSKELAILLSHSAVRELSKEEKRMVKTQLLDICKTVPSLAIFLLPGGSILMPLLVKFIPQLLPSAFNENKT